MKRIEITVSAKGETKIETLGFEGDSCRAATKQLENSLGIRSNETLKPEYYQSTDTNVNRREAQ